ncbi:uncharacterized protein B0J16DRAFT_166331 [Fusarium flagelliforme]|uniref:Apple domain-containing protein n=1 Tax=Fusarium flagelliforme TaxID=2675880 RepID=A0A395MIF4_9HYPO|nr:uncharacterized protein B0J16DRAFT_166331 [Fusarium flagelliforme]KAH7179047.1 hypothetical protein B0J16DRAFT_166331 [Fusarium flagelliforme]RFN46939.1 hypothetical protein FIE12Z_8827 [Fusarium flagelliforme]
MVHSTMLAGTFALFALAGVNAGPCHPSPSITTTAVSTSIAATETLSLSVSAIESATTTNAAESETETVIVAEIGTTTTIAVTTTETEATAAATTTTAAQEEPEPMCDDLFSPYTAAGVSSYQLLCGQIGVGARVVGEADFSVTSYQECLDACSLISSCWGVNYHNSQFTCTMWSQVNSFYDDVDYSTSKRMSF